MFTIAHLADLRFGAMRPDMAAAVLADLQKLAPDLVAVSGNLTRRAGADQFQEARRFLDRIPAEKLVVPGARDTQHLNLFDRFFRPLHKYRAAITSDLAPFVSSPEALVLGINTSRSKKVSSSQAGVIRSRLGSQTAVTVLVSHHPLVPRPVGGTTMAVKPENNDLRVVAKCVDLVLAGHQSIGSTQDTRVAYRVLNRQTVATQAAITPSASSGPDASPYYNAVRIQGDRMSVAVRLWRGTEFEEQGPKSYRFNGTHWDKFVDMPPDFQWSDSGEITPIAR
jgi:3',5'-cyclic AMP phosphodiesterase CpdA